jgi:hypothetical protein
MITVNDSEIRKTSPKYAKRKSSSGSDIRVCFMHNPNTLIARPAMICLPQIFLFDFLMFLAVGFFHLFILDLALLCL